MAFYFWCPIYICILYSALHILKEFRRTGDCTLVVPHDQIVRSLISMHVYLVVILLLSHSSRNYLCAGIYEKFAKAFASAVQNLQVGNGFNEGVTQVFILLTKVKKLIKYLSVFVLSGKY